MSSTSSSLTDMRTRIYFNFTCQNIHFGEICGNKITEVLYDGETKKFRCNRCWKEYHYTVGIDLAKE